MLNRFITTLNRLTRSVTISYLVIATTSLFVVQLLVGAYQASSNHQLAERSFMQEATRQSQFLAELMIEPVITNDFLTMENLVHATSHDPDVVYMVVHRDGRILTRFLNRQHPWVAKVLVADPNGDMASQVAQLRQWPSVFELRAPIEADGVKFGEIWLAYSTQNLDNRLAQLRWATVLNSFGVSFILVAITVLFLNKQIKIPLDQLTTLAMNLAIGQTNQSTEINGQTEIDKLNHAFNFMTQQLEQTLANLRLRELEARKLAYVAKYTSNMVIISDPQGHIEWVNQAFTDNTGYTLAEVRGKRPRQFLHGEDTVSDVVDYMKAKVYQQESFVAEVINYKKNGKPYWVAIEVQPVYDDQQQIINLIAIELDITERKLNEKQLQDYANELKESNQQLHAIIASALDAIITIDQEGHIMEFNPAAEKILGYQRPDVLGQDMAKLIIPPEFRQAHYAGLKRYLATGESKVMGQRLELVAQRADGQQIPIELNLNVIKLGGELIFTAFIHDISERKQAGEALYQSELRYRGVVNSQAELVCRFLPDGILTFVNEAYCNHYNHTPEELIGQSFLELLPTSERSFMIGRINYLTQHQQTVRYERQTVFPNSKMVWHEWTVIVISNSDNEAIELQAVGRDITALKEAEVDLRRNLAIEKELGELKSRFVTMTSHEFRTPLASIMSTASFLEMAESQITSDKRLNRLKKIQNSAREMTILLDDVLTYGKVEAQRFPYRPKSVDFSHFCGQIMEDMQAHTPTHQFVVKNECVGQTFLLDEAIMKHIVVNLLSNAIKYSPEANRVEVWLGQEDGQLIFQVADYGIGIPLNEQKHLFTPFHRATNTQEIRGTGLGLAIVKKAVEAHQSTIEVESELNVGTTFRVKIPIR